MSFHVPERARNTTHPHLGSTARDGNNGVFEFDSVEPGWRLVLLCSDGLGWEHVSVRAGAVGREKSRTPTWKEMAFVKDLCWDGEDVVMQLHPRKTEYVNNHPHVLHLWRPTDATIPTPPAALVGVRPVDASVRPSPRVEGSRDNCEW